MLHNSQQNIYEESNTTISKDDVMCWFSLKHFQDLWSWKEILYMYSHIQCLDFTLHIWSIVTLPFFWTLYKSYCSKVIEVFVLLGFTYIPLYINYCSFVIIPLAGKALYLWIQYIDVFTTRNVELRNLCVACTRDVILNISDSRTQNKIESPFVLFTCHALHVRYTFQLTKKINKSWKFLYFHHYSK